MTALLLELSAELSRDQVARNGLSEARGCFEEAAALYRERRLRARTFDADLFGEPGWDMLLDLFTQQERGRSVSVSSLCIAADVPATTALRWLEVLVAKGLVKRQGDPLDQRRRLVTLTSEGERRMRTYLADVACRVRTG